MASILRTSSYQSIKVSLLKRSLDFEDTYIKVSNEDNAIVKHAIKSLFFTIIKPVCKNKTDHSMSLCVYGDAEIPRIFEIFIFYQFLLKYSKNNVQSQTKYLRQTLVFMWNSAQREKFNFYFLRSFLLVLTKFSFWEDG